MLYLGIDIGTSAVKALVSDDRDVTVAESEVPLTLERPRGGWAEQDPDAWWLAVQQAMAALRAQIGARMADIAAIGLSGQMHGAVLIDAQDRPLRPAILWNDGRSIEECRVLNQTVPDLAATLGVPATPGFTLPKLMWIARHQPDLHRRIAHVLLPKDYIRLKLTGTRATDMSDAAGSLLLDQAARSWWPTALAAAGLTPQQMPTLLEGPAISGELGGAVASHLGLTAGIPVAAGAGDAAAGAIGIGAVADGDSFISLGTSCQLFVTTDSYRPNPAALVHAFAHGLPGRWFQMAAMLNGASALAWAASVVGGEPIASLLAEVETTASPVSPVTFLPYLQGERTPHNDAHARGVFFGMDGGTRRSDLVQSVLEGVAFTLVDAQRVLAASGTIAESYALIGGGARSPLWAEIIASALGRPVRLLAGGEKGPALGAARLARIALTGAPPATVCTKPDMTAEIRPDARRQDALARRFELFGELYLALKPAFRKASDR
jgi:xylulokinase